MHGPQWNNTRIIHRDARYPAIDAFYLVRMGGNREEDRDILPVDVVERGSGKGTVTCALLWMRSVILRLGCRGQRWERYWCMWGCDVGQGCPLPGWGFLRLVGWQYRKINKTNHILLNMIEISYRRYFSS